MFELVVDQLSETAHAGLTALDSGAAFSNLSRVICERIAFVNGGRS